MLLPVLTLLPSATRTAAGTGEWQDLIAMAARSGLEYHQFLRVLRLQINVTAISGGGTPGLSAVFVEDSVDGSQNNANNVGTTSAAITTVSRTILTVGPRGDAFPANTAWPFNFSRTRIRWTVQGTSPNITFDVKGVFL